MDIFHVGGKPYVAFVDYTTNFFDISQLPNKLSSKVVVHAKHVHTQSNHLKQKGQNSQQVHSKLSRNNGTLNMSPQVHTIPKLMAKSKGQFKQLRKASKKH